VSPNRAELRSASFSTGRYLKASASVTRIRGGIRATLDDAPRRYYATDLIATLKAPKTRRGHPEQAFRAM
jgi:hypothetical protein